jgi:hypothetical protein
MLGAIVEVALYRVASTHASSEENITIFRGERYYTSRLWGCLLETGGLVGLRATTMSHLYPKMLASPQINYVFRISTTRPIALSATAQPSPSPTRARPFPLPPLLQNKDIVTLACNTLINVFLRNFIVTQNYVLQTWVVTQNTFFL